ncbi:MAG: hypothetical protein KDI13_04495 [Alphaproteobacteria bacterium]|nr:hypothetical protein [Alphaproteobacteria bacterium]
MHDAYARLVFDWDSAVKYTLSRPAEGKLTLSFDKNASLDQKMAILNKLENIKKLSVVSTSPLKLSLDISKGSAVKAFYVGTRVVLDVYNPAPDDKVAKTEKDLSAEALLEKKPSYVSPKAKDYSAGHGVKNAVEKQTPLKEEPQTQAIVSVAQIDETPPEIEPDVQDKKEETKSEPVIQNIPLAMAPPPPDTPLAPPPDAPPEASHEAITETQGKEVQPLEEGTYAASPQKETPAYTLVDENRSGANPPPMVEKQPPSHETHDTHAAEQAAEEEPPHYNLGERRHTLTVTSMESVGMAVFSENDRLWLITDVSNHLLEPKIIGPTPEIFGDIHETQPSLGTAYMVTLPQNMKVEGEGSGLMWRIVVSDDLTLPAPILPRRQGVEDEMERSGTILWPFEKPGRVIEMDDPLTGQMLKIVTVEDAKQFAGPPQDYVDFEVLSSPVGLVIRPKVDDLSVSITEEGAVVSRPGGLALLPPERAALTMPKDKKGDPKRPYEEDLSPRILNFEQWQVPEVNALDWNKNAILASMHGNTDDGKTEDLLNLAKMHLANGRAAEAIGFLTYAHQELPGLDRSPEFLALRGVSNAFDGKYEVGLGDLLNPVLSKYKEISFWKAFSLANLGDWQQAADVLPDNFSAIYDYPGLISHRLALTLAEIELRAGNVDKADELLALLEHDEDTLSDPLDAAKDYLRGEALRQKGEKQKTVDIWQKLTKGPDDLYRAKAGLALTRLLQENGDIQNKQAIDRLERLRYAWRGDDLEAQINYWLAKDYLDQKDFVKGLMIMRDAAGISADTPLGKRITKEMAEIFANLFLGPDLKNLSPLDTVALYEQFSELTPSGDKGNKMIEKLADHLVTADLLGRAAQLLQHQVDHRLQGENKARVAVRLASIQLLDKKPEKALQSLKKAEEAQNLSPDGPAKDKRTRDIALLRAKALGLIGQSAQALSLLESLPPGSDVSRLKADVAWQAGFWQDAGEALGDVLLDEKIKSGQTLTDRQSGMILNRAIALSLANDRISLANMREKYSPSMDKTTKAHAFEVITRPRNNGRLADRDTLMSVVAEVDLFKDFLDAYKQGDENAATQKK